MTADEPTKGTDMTDFPERISISPVHRQKRDDDFYLVDRDAFPGKGREYVRADLHEAEIKCPDYHNVRKD